METCFENDNLVVKFDKNKRILYSYWNTSIEMKDENYRNLIEIYLAILVECTPSYLLVNAQSAKYAIPIETQDWINNHIYAKNDTKKMALIMSKDFIAQLSFEQVIDDSSSSHTQIRFFDNEENAISWIETVKDNQKRVA